MSNYIPSSTTAKKNDGESRSIAALVAANPGITDREIILLLFANYNVDAPDSLANPPVDPNSDAAPDEWNPPPQPAAKEPPAPDEWNYGPGAAGPDGGPQSPDATAQNVSGAVDQNSQLTLSVLEKILQMLQAQNQALQDFDKRLTDLAGQIKSLKNP